MDSKQTPPTLGTDGKMHKIAKEGVANIACKLYKEKDRTEGPQNVSTEENKRRRRKTNVTKSK